MNIQFGVVTQKSPSFSGEGKARKVLPFSFFFSLQRQLILATLSRRSHWTEYGMLNLTLWEEKRSEEYGEAKEVVERKKQRKSYSFSPRKEAPLSSTPQIYREWDLILYPQ